MESKDLLIVGEVVKPQGIKGEVKVMALTDDPRQLSERPSVLLHGKVVNVLSSRVDKGMVVLRLEGVEDRDAAENLRGQKLYIQRNEAEPLPEGHYYIVDLLGCTVSDDAGKELGILNDILQNGPKDVYIVKGQKGTVLFPALKDLLLDIDIHAKRIMVSAGRLGEVAVYED